MSLRVLLIGGTDSSGGAGLARYIATITPMGAEARIAVTAVTAQTDARVCAVQLMSPDLVAQQISAATGVAAVKIGMLGAAPIVDAVVRNLPTAPLVLDPVIASTSGRPLLDAAGRAALVRDLVPRATLLTPNLPELRLLAAGLGLATGCDETTIVEALMAGGCPAVLVKGGHADMATTCEDRLYLANGRCQTFSGPRYGHALRGTGCQLASAIAVTLGRGGDLPTAVDIARRLVTARFRGAA